MSIRPMRRRVFATLVAIVLVAILATLVDLSGTPAYTLTLGRPIVLQLGSDLRGGTDILLRAAPPSGDIPSDDTMEAARQVLESRINGGLGVAEPVLQIVKDGAQRFIRVEIPGPARDVSGIAQKGELTIVAVDRPDVRPGTAAARYPVLARGADLDPRSVAVDQDGYGNPAVDFALRDPGKSTIATYSEAHVRSGYLGITLDGRIYQVDGIDSPLDGGRIQVRGLRSIKEASDLAATLRYGALPIPLTVAAVHTVGPALGAANLTASVAAGATGLGVVMVFMAAHYGPRGLLADLALSIYVLAAVAVFKLIPVTLTLAGLAGFILSVGMAVDGNILVFERIAEELRDGRSAGAAVELGFGRAWSSIRDANVSTLITCAILWWAGTTFAASTVAGFATTLAIGVVLSLFSAVVVSKTLLRVATRGCGS